MLLRPWMRTDGPVGGARTPRPRGRGPAARGLALGVLLVLCLPCPSARAAGGDPASERPPHEARTLARRYDAAVVRGERLGALQGRAIDRLRLFAVGDGALRPIPFQVDERDPEGEFVFPHGVLTSEDDDRGILDYNDELVFLVQDAGDRTDALDRELVGVDAWTELEILDPLEPSRRAWVYLCSFSGPAPALSPKDYIRYDPEAERIYADHYALGYRKGMSLYTDLHYPDGKGGYGPDLLDRIKVRIRVKFFFNIIRVKKTEEDFRAEVVGWKDGPVRVLRNVQNYVRVLFKLSSPSVFSVTEYYPDYMFTPLRITVPFDLKWVFSKFGISGWNWYFYGDLPGLKDGYLYTNRNREGIPISADLGMDWYEKHLDRKYLAWGYATKEGAGTWFCNIVIPDSIYQFVECYLNIDEKGHYPPEDIPGEYAGGAMMNWKNVDAFLWNYMSTGTYEMGLETFFPPPGFRPEGVQEWRNIREFPVHVEVSRAFPAESVGEGSPVSPGRETPAPAVCARGRPAIITDVRGRQVALHGVRIHIGTMRATGREYSVGQELGKRDWHRVDFDDILRVEHRVVPEDPLTGIERPLVARVTKKDGSVLDLLGCKPCMLSGYRADGRKVGYLATELKRIDFVEPAEVGCPVPEPP